jgi:hypothetical protein
MPTKKTKGTLQRERGLTVYFATKEQKQEFVKHAEQLGLTASFVGVLAIYRAIEAGLFNELDEVIATDKKVLQSETPSARRSAKKKS